MRIRLKIFTGVVFSVLSLPGKAQVAENFEVVAWRGFADAAITYTFDDATSNQYTVAIPMFNEFDFDATFFPVINWSPNWTAFQNAVNQGHEIGSHSVSHTDLSTLSLTAQESELKDSQEDIDEHITGQKCLTLAYPFCIPGNDSLCEKYYIAARNCHGHIEKTTPDDFYSISSITCGSLGSVKLAADFRNRADTAAVSAGWVVYLIHGIDSDGGFSPLSSTELRASLEYLDANRARFWVSTFGNVVRYIRERNAASVTELEATTEAVRFEVTDTLDNSIYNVPLTIRMLLPGDWVSADAIQNGLPLETRIEHMNTTNYIIIDATPDGGDIIVTRRLTSGTGNTGMEDNPATIHIWTTQENIVFTVPETADTGYTGYLYDLNGKEIVHVHLRNHTNGMISKKSIDQGIYILRLTDGRRSYSQQITVP